MKKQRNREYNDGKNPHKLVKNKENQSITKKEKQLKKQRKTKENKKS